MNRNIVQGCWQQFRDGVKSLLDTFSDDRLDALFGKRVTVQRRTREGTGIAKHETRRLIERPGRRDNA